MWACYGVVPGGGLDWVASFFLWQLEVFEATVAAYAEAATSAAMPTRSAAARAVTKPLALRLTLLGPTYRKKDGVSKESKTVVHVRAVIQAVAYMRAFVQAIAYMHVFVQAVACMCLYRLLRVCVRAL